jgi:hypothetical protein
MRVVGKWAAVSCALALVLGVGAFLHLNVRFGSFSEDKIAADAAETVLIRQLNNGEFDAIYDGAADAMKQSIPRAQFIGAVKQSVLRTGKLSGDTSAATTCFPGQVRMVRWFKGMNGEDFTALIHWYVPDGRRAYLVMMQLNPGRLEVDPKVVQDHQCKRIYGSPNFSLSIVARNKTVISLR